MFCIVDIETCGGKFDFARSRITEICIIVHDGLQIVDEFHTLINPECPINPYFINLSGITNAMVEHAPKFYEIAEEIRSRCENRVFVAHHAAFDYQFIKSEFQSLGYSFECDTLCTVRLSRKLLPGHTSYSLGALCSSLGIEIEHRHRAFGDARATALLFERLLAIKSVDPIWKQKGLESIMQPALKARLPKLLDSLPPACGIYFFYNIKNEIIYIGKSENLRKRAQAHANASSSKAKRMMQEVHSISFECTGSPLIALLKENEAIKQWQPRYNTVRKQMLLPYTIDCIINPDEPIRLQLRDSFESVNPLRFFKTKAAAYETLNAWISEYRLCAKFCGLQTSESVCFGHSVKNCLGLCSGNEEISAYNQRILPLIHRYTFSHPNALIIDKGRSFGEFSFVYIEQNSYKGYGYFPDDVALCEPEDLIPYYASTAVIAEHQVITASYLYQHKPRMRILKPKALAL